MGSGFHSVGGRQMKRLYFPLVLLCLGFLLTGCGIEPALSGKARGDYLKVGSGVGPSQ